MHSGSLFRHQSNARMILVGQDCINPLRYLCGLEPKVEFFILDGMLFNGKSSVIQRLQLCNWYKQIIQGT